MYNMHGVHRLVVVHMWSYCHISIWESLRCCPKVLEQAHASVLEHTKSRRPCIRSSRRPSFVLIDAHMMSFTQGSLSKSWCLASTIADA